MIEPTDKDRERARAWAEDEDAHEHFVDGRELVVEPKDDRRRRRRERAMTCVPHTPQRALAALQAVDQGEAEARRFSSENSSHVRYEVVTQEGLWLVTVYNDKGSWDYIEEVVAPDGHYWQHRHVYAEDRRRLGRGPSPIADLIFWHPEHPERWDWSHDGGLG